ncbi:MAG: arginine decarboxylase, pyruvoyl-dependent [Myxococcales bacterium]|nr:arginine decarboxylase, pyruvoyl-dependent [Myxococcales bacterium]
MMFKQPTHFFLAAGSADAGSELNAFDHALLAAGVGDTNLVRMSSICPPACQQVEPFKLPYGALVPVAYAMMASSTPGEIIGAAVAVARPIDDTLPGLIMEHHGIGTREEIEYRVREMAIEGMHYRNREIKDVLVIGAEVRVERHGAAFAGLVLWDGPGTK